MATRARNFAAAEDAQPLATGAPTQLVELVNEWQNEREEEAMRRCIRRGQPYGDSEWVYRTARELGLESTLRAPHRPRKE